MVFTLFKKKVRPAMGSCEANNAVRAQLAAMGDDGAAVRHVVHDAYPTKGADMSTGRDLVETLETRGFEVSDAANENGVVFEHHRTVAPDDFDAATTGLEASFATRGWDHDGWECAVVQKG
ncbi:MAG: ribonuclease E inhibitor RraB [Parvularculaceae bacterium]|nr:ribonuclease E inhibitor RraB [Parvularculaceae bacterium]